MGDFLVFHVPETKKLDENQYNTKLQVTIARKYKQETLLFHFLKMRINKTVNNGHNYRVLQLVSSLLHSMLSQKFFVSTITFFLKSINPKFHFQRKISDNNFSRLKWFYCANYLMFSSCAFSLISTFKMTPTRTSY